MHYVSKGMRKSMTLGFPLVYCGTFIFHKCKKVPLEFTQCFPIGFCVLSDMLLNSPKR